MDPALPNTTVAVRGPKLPFDLIVMILECLSFDKVFSFDDGDVLRETLVAKLNHGDPFDGGFMKSLSEHPQMFSRIARMNVCDICQEDELRLLEGILEQCPNFKSLALGLHSSSCLTMIKEDSPVLQRLTRLDLHFVDEEEDYISATAICEQSPNLEYLGLLSLCDTSLRHLNNHLPNLRRLAKMDVTLYDDEVENHVSLLEEICGKCPTLVLQVETPFIWANIQHCHQIMRRLGQLKVSDAGMNDFPLLNTICDRYPIALKLETNECLPIILKYPAMLRRLVELNLHFDTKEEDLVRLDDRDTFPKLRRLEVDTISALQTLTKCTFVQAKLGYLTAKLLSEKDIFLFNKLRKLCYNLRRYEIEMPFPLLKYLPDFLEGNSIGSSGDHAIILIGPLASSSVSCDFRRIGDILEFKGLKPVSRLHLRFTRGVSELMALALLKRIYNISPNVETSHIEWDNPEEPSTEFIELLKAISQDSGVPFLSCCRKLHVYI